MKLPLTRYLTTVLIIKNVPLPPSLSCLLLTTPLTASTVMGFFHYHRTVFYSELKSKVGNILTKSTGLRIDLSIHGDQPCKQNEWLFLRTSARALQFSLSPPYFPSDLIGNLLPQSHFWVFVNQIPGPTGPVGSVPI
jgi:hypothetical protein